MIEQVKTLNALEANARRNKAGQIIPTGTLINLHVHRLQEAATKTTAYVKTSLSFVGSFGGHISRYAHEWSHLTLDPWVLSTLSQGFRLEFVDDSVQSFGQPNTIRNNKDTQLRTQLRNKCPIFLL